MAGRRDRPCVWQPHRPLPCRRSSGPGATSSCCCHPAARCSRRRTIAEAIRLAQAVDTPPDVRAKAVRDAWFAPGSDIAPWLDGWSQPVMRAYLAAAAATPVDDWWTAGQADVLIVQGACDVSAPVGNGRLLREEIGNRATLIELADVGHALPVEKPDSGGGYSDRLSARTQRETGAANMDSEPQTRIAAEDYLDALAAHGIDHLFCNPGTDFAPIVEAFARAARTNRKVPRPMVVPHENAALSMAHGYTMVTGKPQAVMLHTNVGTANSINMLIDASRDRIPVLLTSGRTPFTEVRRRRLAQRVHPLGAGDVRPGRHAARDGEVGLRDEARRSGRNGGRSRAGTGDGVAERAGLSLAAARGAGRGR